MIMHCELKLGRKWIQPHRSDQKTNLGLGVYRTFRGYILRHFSEAENKL